MPQGISAVRLTKDLYLLPFTLRALKNRVLTKICGANREKVTGVPERNT